MFTLINYHSVGRPTQRGPLSLFISLPVPSYPPAPSLTVIWWSLCWNVNTLPRIPSWRLAISFPLWNWRRRIASRFTSRQVQHFHDVGNARARRGAAPRGNCLISPGFNYLPFPPLGRRKGLRVNERRIDSGEDDEVCAGRLSRPRPLLFAPSRSRGRTECVGSCAAMKWSAGLASNPHLSKQLSFCLGTGSSLGNGPKCFCSKSGEA